MKKVYIQPEAELLSLASLEDFLDASTDTSAPDEWGDNGGNDFADKWS